MKINFAAKTVEVSQTFANKASCYGSEQYTELRNVLRDLPNFEVVIRVMPKRCRTSMRGLTYEYMESCISTVDEDGSLMRDFHSLRQECNYAVAKKWFMTTLPEINNFAA